MSRDYLIEPQVLSGKSVFFTSTLLENYYEKFDTKLICTQEYPTLWSVAIAQYQRHVTVYIKSFIEINEDMGKRL